MFKLEPHRPNQSTSAPHVSKPEDPASSETTRENQGAQPIVPIAVGSSPPSAWSESAPAILGISREPSPLNDPFFRGRIGGWIRRWLTYFEGDRGSRFWGGAAGVLLCLVILRSMWAFGSEQPATHWERHNRPQAVATDGSGLVALDVVVQRRPKADAAGHLLLVTGAIENQGKRTVSAAKVAASFDSKAPAISWAGHWLSPSDLAAEQAQATTAALQKRPEKAAIAPGERLPFVLVVDTVSPNTPFQLHVAAGMPPKKAP